MTINRTTITLFLLLTITVSFSSCKKEEIEKEYPTHHLGKWQLVTVKLYNIDLGEFVPLDYSHANIIYDFRKNNVLIVSGEIEDIEDYKGHEIGEHFYEVLPINHPLSPYKMNIASDLWTHFYDNYVIPSKMELNSAQPDNLLKGRFILEKME